MKKLLFISLILMLCVYGFTQDHNIVIDTTLTYGIMENHTEKDSILIIRYSAFNNTTKDYCYSWCKFLHIDGTPADNIKYLLFFDGEKFHWIIPDNYLEYKKPIIPDTPTINV